MSIYSLSVLNGLPHSVKLWVNLVDAVQQWKAATTELQ